MQILNYYKKTSQQKILRDVKNHRNILVEIMVSQKDLLNMDQIKVPI